MVWDFGVVGFLFYIVWDSTGMPRPSMIRNPWDLCIYCITCYSIKRYLLHAWILNKDVNFQPFKRYMAVIQNVAEVRKLDLASLLHCTIPNNMKNETHYTLNHARKNELGDWVHFAYSWLILTYSYAIFRSEKVLSDIIKKIFNHPNSVK